MAYTHKGPDPNAGSVYNVEQSVGKGAVNASSDVKLVQYLIRHIYGAQAVGVKVDGYIGPVTVSWIERYQKDARARGVNVLVDARIDRALGSSEVSSVSKTYYTILDMNRQLKKVNANAYASLPSQVPLSANPKANPYNPAVKKIVEIKTKTIGGRTTVTYVFSDGSSYTYYPTPSQPAPPPKPELVDVYYAWGPNATVWTYSDGTSTVTPGPPGGIV